MELKAMGRQVLLLDTVATLLVSVLRTDGEKIVKKGGMLKHLEDVNKPIPIAIDPAKVPDPSQMKFI